MTRKQLNFINQTTEDMHDDVASINEEFVDGNEAEVLRLCKGLKKKLDNLILNLKHDV